LVVRFNTPTFSITSTMAEKGSIKRKASPAFQGKSGKKPKGGVATKVEDANTTRSAQKRELKKDRQSTRRHADTVADAKTLWNKLRLKTNTKEETKKLMEQVMTLIRGKVHDIALQHDASRVVQAAIQFGDVAQRKEILTDLCSAPGSLPELSKIQYAHFCSLKLIKMCARDSDDVKLIVKVSTIT
jgi:pumilio family protein 6